MTAFPDPQPPILNRGRAIALDSLLRFSLKSESPAASDCLRYPGDGRGAWPSHLQQAFQFDRLAATPGPKIYLAALNPAAAAEFGLPALSEFSEVVSRLSAYAKAFDAKYGEQIRQKQPAK